jgi:16S rRNA (cytosine967-C5)-methyltransferase
MSITPRQLALDVLDRLERSGELLDPILEEAMAGAPFDDSRDRALFHSLVYGTLRWRERLDWIIGHFSKIPLKKIDSAVINILRLGLFQVVFLDRIPVSAAVNTAVQSAKTKAPPWVAGFVNALLRNAAKNWEQVPLPDPVHQPERHLAVRCSLPRWLVRRWIERFGETEADALCQAVNEIPPVTARVNTLLTSRSRLIATLETECGEVAAGALSPEAVLFRNPASAVSSLESHRKGWFQVQDEAAQLVVHLLDPKPEERVLDACAGLGGKTGHIAQQMQNRGKLIAADKDGNKLSRLASEMDRLSISIVECRPVDLLRNTGARLEIFDRVLLDAPCSGLGVLRKNPDARWRTDKKDLKRFAEHQQRLLERVAPLVKPAGVLVYAVCTTEPEETDGVVNAFLTSCPDFQPFRPSALSDFLTDLVDDRGRFYTFPHRHGTDGFFAQRFIRAA